MTTAPSAEKMTTHQLNDLLHAHFIRPEDRLNAAGAGALYLTEVTAPGGTRRADAVHIGLWQSRGAGGGADTCTADAGRAGAGEQGALGGGVAVRWPLRRKPASRPARGRGLVSGGVVRTGAVVLIGGREAVGRPVAPVVLPRPDYGRIAVLEYDLLGIEPEPGTAAATAVGARLASRRLREAMARPVDRAACPHSNVVDTTRLNDTRSRGMCTRCGAPAVQGDDGSWTFP